MSGGAVAFLNPRIGICGQLSAGDFARLASLGFRTYINNRPDGEAWIGQPPHQELERAAAACGLVAHFLPFKLQTLDASLVRRFHEIAQSDAPGPIVASCASGFRSALVWTIGTVALDGLGLDAAMGAAAEAGQSLEKHRAFIEGWVARLRG